MIRNRLFLLMAGALLLSIAGCDGGPSYQHLDLQSRRLLAGANIQKDIYNTGGGKSLDVNGGVTVGGGKSSQVLGSLPARVGDTTFDTGQTIETRFNTSVYDASLKWRHFFANGPVGYEIAPGIAFTRLNVGASSQTATDDETITTPAFELMLGVVVRLHKKVHVEANSTFFTTNNNFSNVSRHRVLGTYRLGNHFQAVGGYTWLNAEAPSTGGSSYSTMDSGASIGIRFVFDKGIH